MMEMSEVGLIQEGCDLDVFTVFGDDPYTMPMILITKAWMRNTPPEERRTRVRHAGTHLWKFVTEVYEKIEKGHRPCDNKYRKIMQRLVERKVAKSIMIQGGRRPKFNYELTEYGEAVCKKHEKSIREQIRLEKWRRRVLQQNVAGRIQHAKRG